MKTNDRHNWLIARLEKLREKSFPVYGGTEATADDEIYVYGVGDLDAAIADIRGMLQSQQTAVRADDRWRALLAEMRSYNDFEARCADRIESLLAEPVTVWVCEYCDNYNGNWYYHHVARTEGEAANWCALIANGRYSEERLELPRAQTDAPGGTDES